MPVGLPKMSVLKVVNFSKPSKNESLSVDKYTFSKKLFVYSFSFLGNVSVNLFSKKCKKKTSGNLLKK